MAPPLHSELADEMGISEDRARHLLRTLGQEIRSQADGDGVRLPRFGTFRKQGDTLTFAPVSSLDRRVNRRYAGLSPEPVSPRSATNGLIEEEEAPAAESRTESQTQPPLLPRLAWDQRAPFSPHDIEAVEATAPLPSVLTSPWLSITPSAPAGSPADGEPEARASTGPVRVGAAVLAFLVLVGAGWYLLAQRGVVPAPQAIVADETAPTPTSGPETQPPVSSGEARPPENPAPNDTVNREPVPVAPGEIAPEEGGWTIVVGSRTVEEPAASLAETYRERFTDRFPVDVHARPVDGTTRYRVVVGQFASRAGAQAALDAHAPDLPEGAWLFEFP